MGKGKPDVIIPLGNGSAKGNWEVRFLLRSIAMHLKGYGNIYLVTDNCPGFINRATVNVIPIKDTYADNKDANLHKKVLAVLQGYDVDDFVFCADDNAFLQDMDAASIPVLHNPRGRDHFAILPHTIWRKRVTNTFEWAEKRGLQLRHNYECHAPQLFHGQAILEGMKDVDYISQPGLTIYTTWRVLEGIPDSIPQEQCKWTFNGECAETLKAMSDAELCSKPMIGFDDGFVVGGGMERFANLFPEPCKYEIVRG